MGDTERSHSKPMKKILAKALAWMFGFDSKEYREYVVAKLTKRSWGELMDYEHAYKRLRRAIERFCSDSCEAYCKGAECSYGNYYILKCIIEEEELR